MTQKDFSAEDLDLLKDQDAGGSESTEDSSDDKSGDDGSSTEGDKEDSGSILGDLDDIGDDEYKEDKSDDTESKDKTKDDKSDDKSDKDKKDKDSDPVKDWKDAFIAKALSGIENKVTAAKLAKRTDSLRKELSRYKSAEDYMLAGFAAREKIRSGEYRKTKLPEDATEEEVAAWRKDNGIPEKPAAYEIPKVAGHRWTEDDDPFIESFKGIAHNANFSQSQMDAAAKWYAATMAEQQDQYLQMMSSLDKEDRETARDTLRAELGGSDFKPSLILMERLLKDEEAMPNGIGEKMMSARYQDEDGRSRRLINNPDIARFLISVARDTYGDNAMISGDARTTMNNRKKEIEDLMSTDITEYYRRGWDQELLEINRKEEASARRRGKA